MDEYRIFCLVYKNTKHKKQKQLQPSSFQKRSRQRKGLYIYTSIPTLIAIPIAVPIAIPLAIAIPIPTPIASYLKNLV